MEAKPNGCVGDLKNDLNEILNVVVVPDMSGMIDEQCIYKVPPNIREANPQAYTPQIISIGPFHSPLGSSRDNILHKMEKLKFKYFKGFVNRTKVSVDDLVFKFQEWEDRIRSCYAELFSFNSNEFLKIIIVDACFIVELFIRFSLSRYWIQDDPILQSHWLRRDIARDLVLLENQLPFFVLQYIYDLFGITEFGTFLQISITFFKPFSLNLPYLSSERVEYPKHFTDMLRTFLMQTQQNYNFNFDFDDRVIGLILMIV
ncbi:unnamed protein product [Lathyrus sativus]|nr:unnamed protein product [Lathyrus sativus]